VGQEAEDERRERRLEALDEVLQQGGTAPALPDGSDELTERELLAVGEVMRLLRASAPPQSAASDEPIVMEASGASETDGVLSALLEKITTKIEPLRKVGRYEVLRELGSGSYGNVHLAWILSWKRHVALKIPNLRVSLSTSLRQRSYQEAKSLAGAEASAHRGNS